MISQFSNFSKNLVYSISLTASNAGLSLLVWIIAPFFILPEEIGYSSLLLALAFMVVSLLENSFSTAIITFKLSNRKSIWPILVLNLSVWLISMIVFIMLYRFLNFNIDLFDALIIVLIPFISSFNTIFDNFNKLNLHFKENAQIEISANVIGLVFFILLLTKRNDYFPLLAFPIIKYIIINVYHLIFTLKKIVPNDERHKSFHDVFYFGLYILGEKIMTVCVSYADTFIISHQLGMKTLGVYELFKRILVRPIILLTSSVENLALPYLSALKKDASSFLNFYKPYIYGLSLLCFGILGSSYFIKDLIFYVLPDFYSEYKLVFSWLLIYSTALVLLNPIDLILYSSQKSKIFFIWNASYFLPLMLIVFIGASYGLINMIAATSVFYFLLFLGAQFFVMERFTHLSSNLFIKIGMRPLLVSILAFFAAFLIQQTSILQTHIGTGVSLLTYNTMLFILLYFEKNMINDIRSLLIKTETHG
ncbi:MAG: oligosaccharide flippase family protein [Saprospiraceae bacterium]|nr:oligosaccharide flippase family protein [Saprospiraceae bacterium]